MKSLLKSVLVLTVLSLLFSCRQAKETTYSTKTLDCLNELILNKHNELSQKIAVSKKFSGEFKFAEDIYERLSDIYSLESAEQLIAKSELEKAYQKLNSRVIERGYSPSLSKSISTIKAAQSIQKLNTQINELSIQEAFREFARVEAQTSSYFQDIEKYQQWIKSKRQDLINRISADNAKLDESFAQAADMVSISKPELTEITLLQRAVLAKSSIIPGFDIKPPSSFYESLQSKGISPYLSDLKKKAPTTANDFKSLLNKANVSSLDGKIDETLSILHHIE
ncbi:MAG: hypothetical protein NE330_20285, partial [Lentisphaeraceae bacterium]|nr:hypothetical protein [Lentisphaeraceae bacterium]